MSFSQFGLNRLTDFTNDLSKVDWLINHMIDFGEAHSKLSIHRISIVYNFLTRDYKYGFFFGIISPKLLQINYCGFSFTVVEGVDSTCVVLVAGVRRFIARFMT